MSLLFMATRKLNHYRPDLCGGECDLLYIDSGKSNEQTLDLLCIKTYKNIILKAGSMIDAEFKTLSVTMPFLDPLNTLILIFTKFETDNEVWWENDFFETENN